MDIVARAKGLLLSPKTEWEAIAAEPAGDPIGLIKAYAVPMAAIPAICGFVGSTLFGAMGIPGFGIGRLFMIMVLGYALGLVAILVMAKIIEMLQPSFGAAADPAGAIKLAVYTPTAVWVAGIFSLLPPLAFLGILGLYSIYLLYVGVPIVARVPQERTIPFILVLALIGIVINVLVGMLIGILVFMF